MAAAEMGQSFTTSIVVTNSSGVNTNATSAVLTVTLPDQTTATPSVTNDSEGHYHVDYTLTQEGLYRFSWVTDTPDTTETDYVNATAFRSVVGIDDVKTYINFNASNGKEDLLRQIMATATELIEEVVGTCVIRTFTNVRIMGRVAQVLKLPHAPFPDDVSLTSITSVYNGGPTYTQANGDFIVYPASGTVELANYMPFYFGPWKATYKAGRAVISQKIRLAALEICYDLWATQRSYGMDSLEPGPDDTAKWEMLVNTYKIPPHARAMLAGEEMPGFR